MDDDLMPNDGTYFFPIEPKEQAISRKKERAQTLEVLNALEDLVQRFEDRITYYETMSNIPDAVRTNPQEFLILANSYTLAAKTLTSEKEYIQELLDSHAPGR